MEKCVQPHKDNVMTRHGKGRGSSSSDKHKVSLMPTKKANFRLEEAEEDMGY